MNSINVVDVIDEKPIERYQWLVLSLAGLAIIMDGLDNRLLPLAIPSLLIDWDTTKHAFAFVTSVGLIGMVIGTTVGGMLGDRFGRRPLIVGSVLTFGSITVANAFVNNIESMIVVRFLAGLGLGALMPSAASMIAEFTPAKRRTMMVTVGISCIPIGGVLSGFIGAAVLPAFGWRALFIVGGGVSIIIGVILLFALPESPLFLAKKASDHSRLLRLLERMGADPGPGQIESKQVDEPLAKAALSQLFGKSFRLDTVGLWGAFFFVLMVLYMESQWMPTILTDNGYGIEIASIASSCLAFGGMFAAVAGIYALSRFGSRRALMVMAAGAVVLTLLLTQYPFNPDANPFPLLTLLTIVGFLVGGLQIMIYSVATYVYPTTLRSTGIGWSVGMGRIGSVISPFVATAALAAGGYKLFFVAMAIGMGFVFLSLWAIRRHTPLRDKV